MAKYSAVKATVNAYIKQNGRKEITGKILNAVLNATIDSLGKFYQFAGEALPTDDPGTPDQNLTYLAGTAGTYTNFGGLTLDTQEIALLMWDGEWKKQTLLFGIQEVDASVDNQVGTPSVDVDFVNNVLTLSFHNIKGDKGDTGDPAGFGQVTASVDDTIGNPSVQVQTSGEDTAKNIAFEFHGLRGETGITSVVVSVDNTTGNPACSVSLVGQVLHLDFTGLKGLKGDTGVSADYPITIYNGLDSDATDQALSAAQGKVLDGKVSQLGQKVQELFLQELTGAAYATWNTSAGQTHYVIPVNGGEDVSFDNTAGTIYCAFLKSYSTPVSGATPDFCTGYSGRQSYAESVGFTIPTDCRFLIINNPNGNYSLSSLKIKGIEITNGVHGSISNIGDKLKQIWAGFAAFEDGYGRYITPFYPCFVARASSHDDVNMSVSSAGGTISAKNSTILKSFSELTLTGFDKTKPHFVSLFRNGFNGGTEYQIEFSKIDGNTITQVVRFYIPVAQITNAGGINHIDVTDGNFRIQAVIDFSSFPSGGAVTCRTIEYANFVVARHCFESVEEELEEVYNYVDESLASTIKDSDLHLVSGVNLANPNNIDDGHYVSNSGSIAENADWSMVSIPVTAGVKYTFGGFYLGRNGFYCFYNGTEIVGSAVLFSDPNGTQYPVTVTAPVGANKIIIDIKTGNSPTGAYSNLMVNVGETLAQYEPYKVEIDKIKGYQIMGSESGGGDINGLLANLPVSSDGSTIPSGYAYIEQSTGAIKVKMS